MNGWAWQVSALLCFSTGAVSMHRVRLRLSLELGAPGGGGGGVRMSEGKSEPACRGSLGNRQGHSEAELWNDGACVSIDV